MGAEACSNVWRDSKASRWTASFRLFFDALGIYYARWGHQRKEETHFVAFVRSYSDLRKSSKPRILKVPGPIWEHSGWVRNTKANYSPCRLIRCCGAETGRLSVAVFAFWDLFGQRFGWCSTVIPRLTKIIRSGIKFVSRNLISHRFLYTIV